MTRESVRRLLLSLLIGALIATASVIAFSNSEQGLPLWASIIVSTISLAVFPGYILSAYISNNIHNANPILAGTLNFLLYSSLSLGLLSWRTRRKLRRSSKN
jgi:hypothetical protein